MTVLLQPAILMTAVWAAFVTIYVSVPIVYDHIPGAAAWSIMAGGVVVFGAGAAMAGGGDPTDRSIHDEMRYDHTIMACAVIGMLGIIAVVVDKLFLSGIDWSIGITNVRERRAVEVFENVPIHRSLLLYLGYLTFSFSCVSVTLFILVGERLGRFAALSGQISVLPMIIYALAYGARMPILLLILLCVGAALTRAVQGKSFLPSGHWMWLKLIIACIAFLIYTNQVWQNRRDTNRIADYSIFKTVSASRWEMQPSPWLDEAVSDGKLPAGAVMDWLSIGMYITHSPTTVQRMVDHWNEISIYGGLYQVGILSPLTDVLAPSLKLSQNMRSQLMSAGIYGWFPNTWGAWIGDAGLVFGTICVFVWGFLSGWVYRAVRSGASVRTQLMLAFAYMTILISPLNGPFGMANSFLIFASFSAIGFVPLIKTAASSIRTRFLHRT